MENAVFDHCDDFIKTFLEDSAHLRDLRKAIAFKNKYIFERKMGDKIVKSLGKQSDRLLNPDKLQLMLDSRVDFQIAGYHYISFSQGSWFRFIGLDYKRSESSRIEKEYYEEVRNEIPKESNLFTSDALIEPIQIQFGGRCRKRDSVCYLDRGKWKTLMGNLKEVNLLKYVARLPVDEEDSKRDLRFIDKSCCEIREFLDDFYISLCRSISTEAKARLSNQFGQTDSKEKYRWLLKLFVFSFYSTIYAKFENRRLHDVPLYVVIIPYKMEYQHIDSEIAEVVKYATFGGSYYTNDNRPLTEKQIVKLSRYLQILPLYILAQEYSVSWDIVQPSTLIAEDVIRQSTSIYVGEEFSDTQNPINRWQKQFKTWFSEYSYGKSGECQSSPEKDELKKIHDISGYSNAYLSLLENIKNVVETYNKDGGNTQLIPLFIFLHSKPGCGKESIAKITHLLSYRTGKMGKNDDILANTFKTQKKENGALYERFDPVLRKDDRFFFLHENTNPLAFCKIKNKLFFNYFSYNCSHLKEEKLEEELVGSLQSKNQSCGILLKAHLSCGTVFLDEFNTMSPKIANQLLRVFDKPYEVYLEGEPIRLNLMVIFASNRNRDELIEDSFNRALMYRITQNYFRVPPLNERPEDIAVFTNYLLWRFNKEVEKEQKIRYFDLSALRLICELPWIDSNYRGLRGLIEDIFTNRKRRELKTNRISFEEVIDSLKRRELIG